MKKVLTIFGTRPEAIKMAPIINELNKNSNLFESKVCVTGQHREMLDQVLKIFSIKPDYDLEIMEKNQSLTDITCKVLSGMIGVFKIYKPDIVLVHGDTTTTFASSMAAFYEKISVGHVEAGLRSHNKYSPYPEEMNRILTSRIANYHFSPTKSSRNNLLTEGILDEKIYVTGNTVIDALFSVVNNLENNSDLKQEMKNNFKYLDSSKRMILVTIHRRETLGIKLELICSVLKKIIEEFNDIEIVIPVHLNPKVREPIYKILGPCPRVHLTEPQEYISFVYLMNRSSLIITDSGGIQEEAPSLGKPVLVLRDITERPEAVVAGSVILVGTDGVKIKNTVYDLLNNKESYSRMSRAINPYGDGNAAFKIVDILKK
jgi:UDP-N-acetylglucosamine 2-epimerase (non-hydrolysing)